MDEVEITVLHGLNRAKFKVHSFITVKDLLNIACEHFSVNIHEAALMFKNDSSGETRPLQDDDLPLVIHLLDNGCFEIQRTTPEFSEFNIDIPEVVTEAVGRPNLETIDDQIMFTEDFDKTEEFDETSQMKIYLPNQTFRTVKVFPWTDAQDVVRIVSIKCNLQPAQNGLYLVTPHSETVLDPKSNPQRMLKDGQKTEPKARLVCQPLLQLHAPTGNPIPTTLIRIFLPGGTFKTLPLPSETSVARALLFIAHKLKNKRHPPSHALYETDGQFARQLELNENIDDIFFLHKQQQIQQEFEEGEGVGSSKGKGSAVVPGSGGGAGGGASEADAAEGMLDLNLADGSGLKLFYLPAFDGPSSSPQSHPQFLTPIRVKGWLSKANTKGARRRERYFVFTKYLMYYFKSKTDTTPVGCVGCRTIRSVAARSGEDNHVPHAIEVDTFHRQYILGAQSEFEQKGFLVALKGIVKEGKGYIHHLQPPVDPSHTDSIHTHGTGNPLALSGDVSAMLVVSVEEDVACCHKGSFKIVLKSGQAQWDVVRTQAAFLELAGALHQTFPHLVLPDLTALFHVARKEKADIAAVLDGMVQEIVGSELVHFPAARSFLELSNLPFLALNKAYDILQFQVQCGISIDRTDDNARTALHYAAELGDTKAARFFVELQASANRQDCEGDTPLHVAAQKGHSEMVDFLAGCDGTDVDSLNKAGFTPLALAVGASDEEVVRRLLLAGAQANCRCKAHATPLHLAMRSQNIAIPRLLLQHKADVNAVDAKDWTPLHHACRHGHKLVCHFLLQNAANINSQDNKGRTPLLCACKTFHEEVAELLVEHGADVAMKDKKGRCPKDVAPMYMHPLLGARKKF